MTKKIESALMNTKEFLRTLLGGLMVALLLLSSCGRAGKNKTGKIYMPDMTYSNAYETYSANTVKTPEGNEMSARNPVAGTIPYGWIPNDEKVKSNEGMLMSYMAKNHFTHSAANWQAEYDKAGSMLVDPLEVNDENLAEGKRVYEVNCKVCHGEKGEGNGQIVELPGGGDGPYTSRPPAYSTRLSQITDGNMFYAISYGKGMMGGYGFQLSVNERWQVIQYIKKLGGATAETKPADDKTQAAK